jgi:hypothetical protein
MEGREKKKKKKKKTATPKRAKDSVQQSTHAIHFKGEKKGDPPAH